jgi:hypothetical protein
LSEAYWETQLPEVERRLERHLSARFPALAEERADLVGDALLALSAWARRQDRSHPWVTGKPSEAQQPAIFVTLYAVAKTILNRRIADLFRLKEVDWRRRAALLDLARAAAISPSPALDRQLLLRRMLEVTLGVLATLSPAERDLIALVGSGDPEILPLTPAERQRLRRARRKLQLALTAQLGESAASLLRSDS